MTDARSAWSETGEQLTALGSKLGAHFERQRGTEGEQARAQTDEALKRLTDAVRDAFDTVGVAARDEAVQQDVKQVGRSLISALDVTFREVSEEVRKAFDRPAAADKPSPAEDATPPAAADKPTQDRPKPSPPPA